MKLFFCLLLAGCSGVPFAALSEPLVTGDDSGAMPFERAPDAAQDTPVALDTGIVQVPDAGDTGDSGAAQDAGVPDATPDDAPTCSSLVSPTLSQSGPAGGGIRFDATSNVTMTRFEYSGSSSTTGGPIKLWDADTGVLYGVVSVPAGTASAAFNVRWPIYVGTHYLLRADVDGIQYATSMSFPVLGAGLSVTWGNGGAWAAISSITTCP